MQFSENKEQVKYLFTYTTLFIDIQEQYKIISPVNKEEQPKGNTFINDIIIIAKRESLKIFLDARYLSSLTDESKCNRPIETIQVILTKINGKNAQKKAITYLDDVFMQSQTKQETFTVP